MRQKTALVLSGGGARGAYAVGVVRAITEILKLGPDDRAPFDIYSGTSVGSINTTFLAAQAHRGDMGVDELIRLWTSLELANYLKVRGGNRRRFSFRPLGFSRSILDPRPLHLLVSRNISFEQLAQNVKSGIVSAALVAAFDISTAQTVIFSDFHRAAQRRATRDPARRESPGPLTAGQVLASSAMPFVFPSRKIGNHYYCDGGVRFNTPISPAIRAGAERLVIVSLKYHDEHEEVSLPEYPSVPFLAGRLLNALLIDPFEYDLEVLERFNRLTSALESSLPAAELKHLRNVMYQTRGAPYRKLEALVFSPSKDLGKLTNEHLQRNLSRFKLGAVPKYLLKKAARPDATWEAECAAYVLFDGAYAQSLIDLGYQDTMARADELRGFFVPA